MGRRPSAPSPGPGAKAAAGGRRGPASTPSSPHAGDATPKPGMARRPSTGDHLGVPKSGPPRGPSSAPPMRANSRGPAAPPKDFGRGEGAQTYTRAHARAHTHTPAHTGRHANATFRGWRVGAHAQGRCWKAPSARCAHIDVDGKRWRETRCRMAAFRQKQFGVLLDAVQNLRGETSQSVVRSIGNVWATNLRLYTAEGHFCLLGCPEADDTTAHCLSCPHIRTVVPRATGSRDQRLQGSRRG